MNRNIVFYKKKGLHQIIAHHEWHISFHIGLVVVLY